MNQERDPEITADIDNTVDVSAIVDTVREVGEVVPDTYRLVGLGATLNRYTGNIVDWNRVGELLQSQNHRYSIKELSVRFSIILGTTVGTYVLGYLMSLRFGNFAYFIAFVLSSTLMHGLAIEGLIKKRLAMISDIENIKKEIEIIVDKIDSSTLKEEIEGKIDHIMKLEAKNNASSATLGMRKRLLSDLLRSLKHSDEIKSSIL